MLSYEDLMEKIYKEPKFIPESVSWHHTGQGRLRLETKVYRKNGDELILYGVKGKTNFSFTLRYKGVKLVRRWDFPKHNNPDGTVIPAGTPHKHKLTESYGEDWAYVVDDIPKDDINKAFIAFLQECNIVLREPYANYLFPS